MIYANKLPLSITKIELLKEIFVVLEYVNRYYKTKYHDSVPFKDPATTLVYDILMKDVSPYTGHGRPSLLIKGINKYNVNIPDTIYRLRVLAEKINTEKFITANLSSRLAMLDITTHHETPEDIEKVLVSLPGDLLCMPDEDVLYAEFRSSEHFPVDPFTTWLRLPENEEDINLGYLSIPSEAPITHYTLP